MVYKNKFETIRDELKKDIHQGIYGPGERLPTEVELTAKYGVNQGTINKVVSALASEGLVARKPRTGSVVLDVENRKVATRLAVCVVRSHGHLFARMFTMLTRAIQDSHCFPLLVDIGEYESREETEQYIGAHLAQAVDSSPEFVVVDGMAYFPFEFFKKLKPEPRNLVFINRCESPISFNATYILSDYERGGYLGAEYLLKEGHRNILVSTMLCRPYSLSEMRISGVKRAFADYGLEFSESNLLVAGNFAGMEKELTKRFSGKNSPTAVFAFSDSEARDVQKILERESIFFGRDYDMVGYFNTPWAVEIEPKMTSVSINEEGIMDVFSKVIAERTFPKEEIKIDPELVVRNSEERFQKTVVAGNKGGEDA